MYSENRQIIRLLIAVKMKCLHLHRCGLFLFAWVQAFGDAFRIADRVQKPTPSFCYVAKIKTMFWIFLIVIIIVVFLVINKEHKESVKKIVVNYGSMRIKYTELISYLSQGAKIDKVTKDSLRISSSSMVWFLDVVGDDIEIKMKGLCLRLEI